MQTPFHAFVKVRELENSGDLLAVYASSSIVNSTNLSVFDVIIFDEAHNLKNHETKKAATLKAATPEAFKILLTATPMQNSIMDLYGLVHFIDDTIWGDADEFYRRYYRKPENYHELSERVSSIVNMGVKNPDGAVCYIIGIRGNIRAKIGKQPGDTVRVTIQERE